MSNNKVLLQVRLKTKEITMDEVDETAQAMGYSRSALAVEGLKLLVEWDPDFYKTIQLWADRLQVKPATFIENICLDWLARLSGEMEVHGPKVQQFPEFIHYGDELMTGKDFYEKRRQDYIKHFKQELAARDAERAKTAKEG